MIRRLLEYHKSHSHKNSVRLLEPHRNKEADLEYIGTQFIRALEEAKEEGDSGDIYRRVREETKLPAVLCRTQQMLRYIFRIRKEKRSEGKHLLPQKDEKFQIREASI